MLITWTVDSLSAVSKSMQSRGSLLRGRKAFSIYRFDNRDRTYVVSMFTSITVTLMGVMLNQTDIVYDPKIIVTPITSMSFVFFFGYAVLCFMPLGLELFTEYKFRKSRNKNFLPSRFREGIFYWLKHFMPAILPSTCEEQRLILNL